MQMGIWRCSVAALTVAVVLTTTGEAAVGAGAGAVQVGEGVHKQPEDLVRKVLTAAGKKYKALRDAAPKTQAQAQTGDADKRAAAEEASVVKAQGAAAAQAKQALQVAQALQALNVAGNAAEKKLRARASGLVTELKDAESQVVAKTRSFKVQEEMEKEKSEAASQETKSVVELKARAEKLRKEAEVASEIAKEKTEALAIAEKEQAKATEKARGLQEQRDETAKFLGQTKAEERALEQKVSALKQDEAIAQKALADELLKEKLAAVPAVVHKVKNATAQQPAASATRAANATQGQKNATTQPAAAFATGATNATQAQKNQSASVPSVKKPTALIIAKAAVSQAPPVADESEAMRKLVLENQQLKHEKQVLEQQLTQKTVKQEKALLKQHLKNKLVRADRHLTAKKVSDRK